MGPLDLNAKKLEPYSIILSHTVARKLYKKKSRNVFRSKKLATILAVTKMPRTVVTANIVI